MITSSYQWFIEKIMLPALPFFLASVIGYQVWINVQVNNIKLELASHESAQDERDKALDGVLSEIKQGQRDIIAGQEKITSYLLNHKL